jgi:hypothetical protein
MTQDFEQSASGLIAPAPAAPVLPFDGLLMAAGSDRVGAILKPALMSAFVPGGRFQGRFEVLEELLKKRRRNFG